MQKNKYTQKIFIIKIGDNIILLYFLVIFACTTKNNKIMDTRITFDVNELGFPNGKIYRMWFWVKDENNPQQYFNKNENNIIKQLTDYQHIHSIEYKYSTSILNSLNKKEYGVFVFEKELDFKPTPDIKNTTDIRKVDLPKITIDDLNLLKYKIDIEIFKREHTFSDKLYNFYVINKDLIDVNDVKEYCNKFGTSDSYILKKQEIRKKLKIKL